MKSVKIKHARWYRNPETKLWKDHDIFYLSEKAEWNMKNRRGQWRSEGLYIFKLFWKLSCGSEDRSLLCICGLCWKVYDCQEEEMWLSEVLSYLYTIRNQLPNGTDTVFKTMGRRWKQHKELYMENTGNWLTPGAVEGYFIRGCMYSFIYWTVHFQMNEFIFKNLIFISFKLRVP